MNIVIMAGGGGTRLWPLSRRNKPKQFLDLGSGRTLLEQTYDRAKSLARPADIFVATNKTFLPRIKELLPQLPAANIFLEPEKRDTAPAFAAAAVQLKVKQRADQPTIFMWADHVFTDEAAFTADLQKIPPLITKYPQAIIIMGHVATFPETGLGYIEVNKPVHNAPPGVFHVKAFKEKPDRQTAADYVAAGKFFWNMAYISTTPNNLLQKMRQYEPELMQGIAEYELALRQGGSDQAETIYKHLPKLAIDYALLERDPDIIAVTGDWGWSDVGYWSTVQEIFGTAGDHTPRGRHFHVSSTGCFIYNDTDQAVSLIGLKDTIVVVTKDAILVANKNETHKIKELVARLEVEGTSDLL